ncbi:hypothetical protein GGR56DRAFT_424397 [Xylariaceae sp. FL0804]|nr:hypothetical protein GGR56DRAFT_424397 [Xylariaceae sp. FL0804]
MMMVMSQATCATLEGMPSQWRLRPRASWGLDCSCCHPRDEATLWRYAGTHPVNGASVSQRFCLEAPWGISYITAIYLLFELTSVTAESPGRSAVVLTVCTSGCRVPILQLPQNTTRAVAVMLANHDIKRASSKYGHDLCSADAVCGFSHFRL